MRIPRYYDNLENYLTLNKALLIFGPRQVGKTTVLNDFLKNTNLKYKLENGDNIKVQDVLSSEDFDRIKEFVEGYELIAIDEAQKIKNIGTGLKIIVDQVPGIKVIATGSSSFELLGQTGEPLTGRKTTIKLFPVAQLELKKLYNNYELKDHLPEYLIFGGYPSVVAETSKNKKIELLNEIVESYLLKDIIEFEKVKGSKTIFNLLKLLAFQIGSEVSLSELAQDLGTDHKTVGRYIDILEQSFIIYPLTGFSRNLRSEINKKNKYYFYDNGIRNAIISNFNDLSSRDDIGQLWENFLFMERLKKREYNHIYVNAYFWRTWEKQEIDLIEEEGSKLHAYEFKWSKDKVKVPSKWSETYKDSTFEVITKDNYLDFVL